MHIMEVFSNEEEMEIPVLTVPLTLSSLPFSQNLTLGPAHDIDLLPLVTAAVVLVNTTHISTLNYPPPLAGPSPFCMPVPMPVPPLIMPPSAAEWSLLINQVQSGTLPFITIVLAANTPSSFPMAMNVALLGEVFMKEAAIYFLDIDPGTLLDCLIQMALKKVFIPLSMLTT